MRQRIWPPVRALRRNGLLIRLSWVQVPPPELENPLRHKGFHLFGWRSTGAHRMRDDLPDETVEGGGEVQVLRGERLLGVGGEHDRDLVPTDVDVWMMVSDL